MNAVNNVVLRFHSDTADVVRLTIPRANMNLTAEEAEDSMNAVIDGGIVVTGNGIPVKIKGAELITTERTQLV